ncbi:MAG: hypothetical protein K2M04_03910 [Muribaculaceae bacterium]|nr:hypothetical protein [Muribaculaceae bacterium]
MGLVNICPDIPDDWKGGVTDTARILGLSDDTIIRYTKLGRKGGGIEGKKSKRGRTVYYGKEIKRFWNEY